MRKLAKQKISPFPIISQPSALSFTLQLPSAIHIHSVFHVSQLKPEHPNTLEDSEQPAPPPLIVDGAPKYLIDCIIDLKYNCTQCKCQLSYHVKWTGYPISNNPSNWILTDAFDDDAGRLLPDTHDLATCHAIAARVHGLQAAHHQAYKPLLSCVMTSTTFYGKPNCDPLFPISGNQQPLLTQPVPVFYQPLVLAGHSIIS